MTIRFKIFKPQKALKQVSRYTYIYVRLRDGQGTDQTVRTDILVLPFHWDPVHERIKPRSGCPLQERAVIDAAISRLRSHIASSYVSAKINGKVGTCWLKECVNLYYKRPRQSSFDDLFNEFLCERDLSAQRVKQYKSLNNIISRFNIYMSAITKSAWQFNVARIEQKDLDHFRHFLAEEHNLIREIPKLKASLTSDKPLRPRGKNTINDLFKKLRAFFNWCEKEGHINSSPFENYHIEQELYGTPVSLSTEEIRTIANADLRSNKALARQRDIFVFQCNIGCRVSDLVRLKKSDIVDGKLSYIPSKTIKDNPRTVVVPLNCTATAIVNRYAHKRGDKLLPFITTQKYNASIKMVLKKCGITREVTILDPLTRREKRVPICEVASSHLARRSFVNNIYKKVKDPALVSALTGHVEGSKAFSRYRDIDENVKCELVGLLE